MRCEKCDGEIRGAYWHQKRPVERELCLSCAYADQKSNSYWHGEKIVFGGDGVKYKADYDPPKLD